MDFGVAHLEPGELIGKPTAVDVLQLVQRRVPGPANFDNPVHLNSDKLKFQTKDPTEVRTQKLVFGAGSYSGWHHHPGTVFVADESGAVTLWDSDCNSKTYGPGLPDGAVFAEDGDDPVRATSTNGATV